MKQAILFFALALAAVAAHAAPEQFYLVNGKPAEAGQAFAAAAKGGEVYQCKPMELRLNNAGTGVSLKVKPRVSGTVKF